VNLVLLDKKDFVDHETVVLKGRRLTHLLSVNKVREKDSLVCGLLNGKIGTGTVKKQTDGFLEMRVELYQEPPEPLPLTLVLALPRPKMLKRIIEAVTTLGIKKIYLINSWRVEKSFWQSPLLDMDELQKYMVLGLEQGRDTTLPRISLHRFFTQFATEELPLISKNSLKIAAHPKAGHFCPSGVNTETTLVIGPEGGFIDIEVETLTKLGFLSCHIGPRILKVETAVTFLIARLFG
jgi:RsmE family RNA methyltransferase